MQYCAMDVEATHQVFTEQLPLFLERSVNDNPHIFFIIYPLSFHQYDAALSAVQLNKAACFIFVFLQGVLIQ